jgi:hypothetical protein
MKATTILKCLPVLSVFLFFALTADHPPSTLAAYSTGVASPAENTVNNAGCALHEGFVPVAHTGRRYLIYLMDQLGPAAGVNPAEYSLDIIRETNGPEYINAMTCSSSKVIWVSRQAYRQLYGYEPALAFLMAHEIGHGSARSVHAIDRDWMNAVEKELHISLTYRQRIEVSVDQRAADIMLKAGYSKEAILGGSRYILQAKGADLVLQEGPSHPSGWDRLALLSYYLDRNVMASEPIVGRVFPREW